MILIATIIKVNLTEYGKIKRKYDFGYLAFRLKINSLKRKLCKHKLNTIIFLTLL